MTSCEGEFIVIIPVLLSEKVTPNKNFPYIFGKEM